MDLELSKGSIIALIRAWLLLAVAGWTVSTLPAISLALEGFSCLERHTPL
jgi:hypothetical protein